MKHVIVWLMALMMTACIVPEPAVRSATFDFGNFPPVSSAGGVQLPVLAIEEVQAPRRLDSTYMYYRLAYANGQEPRPYANSRWTMSPPQLFMQRMKMHLAQVVSIVEPVDAVNAPVLKIELDAFEQEFVSKDASRGIVRFRATLIRNRHLLAQKYFAAERPAATADAAGGVQALTQATDAVLDDLAAWVQVETTGKP